MKRNILLSAAAFCACAAVQAQTIKQDSVSMGAGYPNQIYYKMSSGQTGSSGMSNWDIAHTSNVMGATIRANQVKGVQVIAYPKSDNSGWASFDTTGFRNWKFYYNSLDINSQGAFNMQGNGQQWDFSWGVYNLNTNEIEGDSLYLIAWLNSSGTAYTRYMKLMLIKQKAGDLIMKYANVDGTGEVTDTILQSAAANQNYKYYDFNLKKDIVREPAKNNWDINFARYMQLTWNGSAYQYYPTMGIETNPNGVKVAEINGKTWAQLLPDTPTLANTHYAKLTDSMTAIGSDWKVFNGVSFDMVLDKSFIVKDVNANYWLLNFTRFDGSSNGRVVFNHVQLKFVAAVQSPEFGEIKVFPNPVKGKLYLSIEDAKVSSLKLSLNSMSGQQVYTETLRVSGGFNATGIDVSRIPAGVYNLQIGDNASQKTVKVVIQ